MKRLLFVGAAVIAGFGVSPTAQALVSTDLVGASSTVESSGTTSTSSSKLNPILNKVPLLEGPDRRHLCVISDHVDRSWCFYVAIP